MKLTQGSFPIVQELGAKNWENSCIFQLYIQGSPSFPIVRKIGDEEGLVGQMGAMGPMRPMGPGP